MKNNNYINIKKLSFLTLCAALTCTSFSTANITDAAAKTAKSEGLVYNGHPLRRKDNLIYYGTMSDKYIIQMQILETKKEKDLDVATKVAVQLQLTDSAVKSRDRIVKKSEKDGFWAAMDVASVWLDRALANK